MGLLDKINYSMIGPEAAESRCQILMIRPKYEEILNDDFYHKFTVTLTVK